MNSASSAVEKGVMDTRKRNARCSQERLRSRARQMVELGLLAEPENSQRHKAHHVHQQPRRQCDQGAPQIVLAVNGFAAARADPAPAASWPQQRCRR